MFSCVSRQQVVNDYDEQIDIEFSQKPENHGSPQTLVFFLVDGLSVPLVQKLFSEGLAPNIRSMFLPNKTKFRLARATFPSLTHVNISSIITTRNVDRHPIIGNKILNNGKLLNFESPFVQKKFSKILEPISIFSDLTQQNRSSMSFAPFYGDQATARYGLDLKMGLAYRSGDYAYVDKELLESATFSLSKLPLKQWPEFIFIHIIGIDAIEHHRGHLSKESIHYSKFIDHQLGPVLQLLNKASASGKRIGAIMTSDHGMSELNNIIQIDKQITKLAPKSIAINQGRLISLKLDEDMSLKDRRKAMSHIGHLNGVEMTILKRDKTLEIFSSQKNYTIKYKEANCGIEGNYALKLESLPYLCPSKLNQFSQKFFYPYFATNIAAYFYSDNSPDALVLAKEKTSFGDAIHAHHGGLTFAEIQVPLLLWNINVKSSDQMPQTFRLLESLRTSF